MNSKMNAAWNTWRAGTKSNLHMGGSAEECFKRWVGTQLRGCFDTWRELAEELGSWQFSIATAHWAIWSSMAALMTWRVASMQRQVAVGWWDVHSTHRASWSDKVAMLRLFDRGMVHCKSREVAGAYQGWLSTMRHGCERGLLEMWAVVWCSVQKVRFGITHWHFNAAARAEAAAISLCAYAYWKNKVALDHFSQWLLGSRFQVHMARIGSTIRSRLITWAVGNMAQCWKQWKQVATVHRAGNLLLVTASRMWSHKWELQLFRAWRTMARRTQAVISSLKTLEGEHAGEIPMWAEHKLNWGVQVRARPGFSSTGGAGMS